MKLVLIALLLLVGWRLITGRWPWQPRGPAGSSIAKARILLGVGAGADRAQVAAAHRATLARVHPDRGGSNEAVHAADTARDLLLAEITLREQG